MKTKVVDITGKKVGDIELKDEIFAIEPRDHAIYLDVKQHLANRRQGTHKTKERSDVAGSTRKIKKQKGTGTARAGDIKSPIFRGGGRVFGPVPRSYGFKVNKKVKKLARKSALSYKAKSELISVIDKINFDAPKTKSYIEFLDQLKMSDKKTLLVLEETNKNVYLSARNLSKTKVVTASQLNTYDLINADVILLTKGSVKRIEEQLS